MKHVVIILVILLTASCKSNNPGGCGQFKTGQFETHTDGMIFKITRSETIQTEIIPVFGDTMNLSVNWIDDCHYQLRMLESSVVYPDTIENFRRKAVLSVEIMSWTNDYYIYRSETDILNKTLIDTMWIDRSR